MNNVYKPERVVVVVVGSFLSHSTWYHFLGNLSESMNWKSEEALTLPLLNYGTIIHARRGGS